MNVSQSARSIPACLLAVVVLLLGVIQISCGGSAVPLPAQTVQPANPPTVPSAAPPETPPPPPAPPASPPPAPAPPPPPAPPAPPPPPPPPVTAPPPPAPANDVEHVFIVVEENKNYSDVIGSTHMPYLNSLATANAVAENFFGNGTESLPNYFMLTVGETVTTGAAFSSVVKIDNVVRELNAAKKVWKVYAESLPSVGYLGPDRFPYVKVHNPFAYLSDVVNDPEQAKNIVPFTQFAADLAAGTLPDYGFIIPNNNSNSHNCPPNMATCSLADTLKYADSWLKTNIDPLVTSATFQQHGLLIITWDESRTSNTVDGGGHVATVIVGSTVKPGFRSSTFYQHESTLRLMMKALDLTNFPNKAATAPDMGEFFTNPLP